MSNASDAVQESFGRGLIGLLGFNLDTLTPDLVELSCPVTQSLWQPFGLVHGGVYCSLIETAASLGGAAWWGERGDVVGVANHTNFIRATREGVLKTRAVPVHRGRSQQLWQADVFDGDDRLVSRGEVRLMNLESSAVLGAPTT